MERIQIVMKKKKFLRKERNIRKVIRGNSSRRNIFIPGKIVHDLMKMMILIAIQEEYFSCQ